MAKRTPAQQQALARNWRIFNLRGLESRLVLIAPEHREDFLWCLDKSLEALGAETISERRVQVNRWVEAGCPDDLLPNYLKKKVKPVMLKRGDQK